MTTLLYIAVIFAICAFVAWLDEANDRRQARRRRERLRERRAYLDNLEPKRWTT